MGGSQRANAWWIHHSFTPLRASSFSQMSGEGPDFRNSWASVYIYVSKYISMPRSMYDIKTEKRSAGGAKYKINKRVGYKYGSRDNNIHYGNAIMKYIIK